MSNGFFYCYSPALSQFLQENGLRYECVGINENSGKKFWQYVRGAELDEVITKWQANNPNKRRR